MREKQVGEVITGVYRSRRKSGAVNLSRDFARIRVLQNRPFTFGGNGFGISNQFDSRFWKPGRFGSNLQTRLVWNLYWPRASDCESEPE
jgi:hypothetical protein